LTARGFQPGDGEWEAQGICRAVTWPRSKFTILGRREDGTALQGDYLTGKRVERERQRRFVQIGFIDRSALDTLWTFRLWRKSKIRKVLMGTFLSGCPVS
jgi:adenine-specific DNA-methyltransferase